MFKWNGTDVTELLKHAEIYEADYNKKRYWYIKLLYGDKELTEYCMVRACKGTIPCLIDELKPIFRLPKLGTQWCIFKGKYKQLIRCVKNRDGSVREDLKLTQMGRKDIDDLLTLQVQEIYTFRELLGITRSSDSSIILRKRRGILYAVSFYEPNMLIEDKKVIPYSVLEKWFGEVGMEEVVKRITKIKSIDQLTVRLHEIRGLIEKAINRVDKNNIGYVSAVSNRIAERVQGSL